MAISVTRTKVTVSAESSTRLLPPTRGLGIALVGREGDHIRVRRSGEADEARRSPAIAPPARCRLRRGRGRRWLACSVASATRGGGVRASSGSVRGTFLRPQARMLRSRALLQLSLPCRLRVGKASRTLRRGIGLVCPRCMLCVQTPGLRRSALGRHHLLELGLLRASLLRLHRRRLLLQQGEAWSPLRCSRAVLEAQHPQAAGQAPRLVRPRGQFQGEADKRAQPRQP
mmetsp:Transcript_14392/g.43793  ORF Transcript_14392/g.43793 Transcript_14392/m.43793 type:complete len:229 (-) Transcript_14392:63-749(-)